ncbi:MAG: MarR family transcriptional regulator [Alphaproteobacteria bacterium]|nr:MarR family transcriptional regulator [Alphaproteobacteria bacterium]
MTTDLSFRRLQADILLDLQRLRHVSERRIGEMLEARDLAVTPAQANVLMTLFQNRGPLTARQLARDMQLSEVTVGRFVRALEKDGWVVRKRDPSDSRAILVDTTDKTRAALPRFIEVSNAIQDAAFAGLDRATVERIGACTRRILDNLADAPRTGPG